MYCKMLPAGVPEYRVQTKPSLVEHWRHLVEIVALITAAVWAFLCLRLATNVAHESLQGNKELLTINVTFKNAGAIPGVNMRSKPFDL